MLKIAMKRNWSGRPVNDNPQENSATMKKRIRELYVGLYFAAATLATAQGAHATLGESVDSVESDRKVFSAVKRTAPALNGYTVQEIKSDANVVREYISPAGIVFAIAWNGLSHPDLTTLLGAYVGEYQQALQQTTGQKGKRHLQVKTDRIIVEKWGHMRNMQGRAYIPALIPSGVSINELK
jgi:hypothetical protein